MIEVRTPETHPEIQNIEEGVIAIFLAGSIENGNAPNWQNKIIDVISNITEYYPHKIVIYNPRRSNWDKNLDISVTNGVFKHQVQWELFYLTGVDLPVFYFADDTISPISLLELGIMTGQLNCSEYLAFPVYATSKYFRQSNLQITGDHFGSFRVYDNESEFVERIVKMIDTLIDLK